MYFSVEEKPAPVELKRFPTNPAIEAFLKPFNFTYEQTYGDGHCFYASLCHFLDTNIIELRETMVKAIKQFYDIKAFRPLKIIKGDYFKKIITTNEFAGLLLNVEFNALCRYLDIRIDVWTENNENKLVVTMKKKKTITYSF